MMQRCIVQTRDGDPFNGESCVVSYWDGDMACVRFDRIACCAMFHRSELYLFPLQSAAA
jgi:hypothetical protein